MNNENNIIICPNCNDPIIIQEINCGIFRHGVMKTTGEQIDPHLEKNKCHYLFNSNQIYGCGKPFRISVNPDKTYFVEICDYI
jgi:hypothetical protein